MPLCAQAMRQRGRLADPAEARERDLAEQRGERRREALRAEAADLLVAGEDEDERALERVRSSRRAAARHGATKPFMSHVPRP